MFNVLSILKLAIVIILGFFFLFGLGWIVVGPLWFGKNNKEKRSLSKEVPFALMVGLLVDFLITLVSQKLTISLIIGGFLSIGGLVIYFYSLYKNIDVAIFDRNSIKQILLVLLLCFITIGPIIADPISDYDARSIWFFHAKMIYSAGTIGLSAGWSHPSLLNSHVDYPILFSALTAQIMHVIGFWNEYLPKISLLFLWIPAIIWLFSFSKKTFSFFFLIVLVPFSFYPWIWDGYLDGLLATYFVFSLLLFGRFIQDSDPIDLVSSFTCILLILNLKNEGTLGLIAWILGIVFFVLVFKKKLNWNLNKVLNLKKITLIVLSFLPSILWTFFKAQWNLSNDLGIGTSNSFSQLMVRLSDGSVKIIVKYFLQQMDVALMIIGIILVVIVLWKKPFSAQLLPVIISGVVYGAGIFLIYLITPKDLVWHLQTSVIRTLMPVNGALYVICYFSLVLVENTIFVKTKNNFIEK